VAVVWRDCGGGCGSVWQWCGGVGDGVPGGGVPNLRPGAVIDSAIAMLACQRDVDTASNAIPYPVPESVFIILLPGSTLTPVIAIEAITGVRVRPKQEDKGGL